MTGRRGHSLIELVVAFGLVGLLVLFVLSLFPGVNRALRFRDDKWRAEQVAAMTLEAAGASAYEAYPVGAPRDLPPLEGDLQRFARQLAVTAVPGHDPSRLKKLTVTVRDRGDQARTLERSRYIYQLGN